MAIYNTRPLQSGVCVEMTLTAVYCGSGGVFVRSVTLSDQILELVVEVVEAIRAVEKSWLLATMSIAGIVQSIFMQPNLTFSLFLRS